MMPPRVSRQTLTTLLVALWSILFGGIRIFAWDSLKRGFIDIRPLPRVARLLALVGLVMVFIFIASIFFNDTLRLSGALEPLPLGSTGTHGIFVPALAVPLSFLASILAWTFLITGALHVQVAVRWLVLFAFFLFGLSAGFAGMLQGANSENPNLLTVTVLIAVGAVVLLIISFLVLPRLHLPLVVEFILMLALTGGLFVLNFYGAAESSRLGTVDFVSGYLVPDVVTNPRTLITPLLYLSGAEMIGFGISLSGWGTLSAQRYARPWIVVVLLVALLGYRWFSFLTNDMLPGVSIEQIQQWLGALLAGIVLIPVALWRARHAYPDHVPLKLVMGFILSIIVPQILIIIVITVVTSYFSVTATDPNALAVMDRVTFPLQTLSEWLRSGLYLQLATTGALVAFFAVRRQRYTVAAFGIVIAWTQFVWWFMENGRPLQAWRYQYSDIEPWILLALTTLTLYWGIQKQLTPPRALALLGLVFFAWVLNFTDFLDNPLALFFGFAGIFFTAFGILWGVLTAGGKFANFTSLRFPRLNRIVLYLGYVLLTLNLTHWYTVTHNVEEQVFNGDLTLTGLRIFGYTAAYLVFVEGGRALFKQES